MALSIVTPKASFVRFDGVSDVVADCISDNIRMCLPVYLAGDVSFQFVIEGPKAEIDTIYGVYGTPVQVGLVDACDDADFALEFEDTPQVFRLSDTQLLVNWPHGFPLFDTIYSIGECFKIRVQIGATKFCSNCFTRIAYDCFTSVLEYGAEENAFGFNYCNAGEMEGDEEEGEDATCESTVISFVNQSLLSIPYTASMVAKYGNAPTVQVWLYDENGDLIHTIVQITMDGYPPAIIEVDLAGVASGIVVIN